VTTIGSCKKQKIMNKVRGIYQGVFFLSFVFFIAASFICISLLGYCTEDWLLRNLLIGGVAELVSFFWGINSIKKGGYELLRETHSLKVEKELYMRILFLMGFGMMFSLIILVFPYGGFSSQEGHLDPILIYALNIFVPAAMIFVWMGIKVSRINRKMRI
jgi:hypothetical protein